jgi:hypothetical protein
MTPTPLDLIFSRQKQQVSSSGDGDGEADLNRLVSQWFGVRGSGVRGCGQDGVRG